MQHCRHKTIPDTICSSIAAPQPCECAHLYLGVPAGDDVITACQCLHQFLESGQSGRQPGAAAAGAEVQAHGALQQNRSQSGLVQTLWGFSCVGGAVSSFKTCRPTQCSCSLLPMHCWMNAATATELRARHMFVNLHASSLSPADCCFQTLQTCKRALLHRPHLLWSRMCSGCIWGASCGVTASSNATQLQPLSQQPLTCSIERSLR